MLRFPALSQPLREFPAAGLIWIRESGQSRGALLQAFEVIFFFMGTLDPMNAPAGLVFDYRTFIKLPAIFGVDCAWVVNR
jgi:hypothetical protein